MYISMPDEVSLAIQQLNAAGYEAYVVGGCVRDFLRGEEPEDWDITTSATPTEMQDVFSDRRVLETGTPHGTLTVIIGDTPLEITTYRVDGDYSDGRHPDSVHFTRSLAEDLRRRDFTINAMAYHPDIGLVDLYHGQEDLSAKRIRCVGDAEQRFNEDALRILRALRFATTLQFTIEPQTEVALKHLAPTLTRVSRERIMDEFYKMLRDNNAGDVMEKYKDVLSVILPEVSRVTDFSLIEKMPRMMEARVAALFWHTDCEPSEITSMLQQLRFNKRTVNKVGLFLSCRDMPAESNYDLLRLLNRISPDLIGIYLTLRNADDRLRERVNKLISENACYKIPILAVDGDDVIAAGIEPGPEVGRVLYALLDAVMEEKCPNRKEDLLEWIAKNEKPVP